MVPALVESIKVAGLVLVTDTFGKQRNEDVPKNSALPFEGLADGIDGVLRGNGVLKFVETIDL